MKELLVAMLLVGCSGSSRVASSRYEGPRLPDPPPPPSLADIQNAYVPSPAASRAVARGFPVDRDLATCTSRVRRVAELEKELEEARLEMDSYVRERCTGEISRPAVVDPRGDTGLRGGPRRVWLCDGKIVDVPETIRYQNAVFRLFDAKMWLKKTCSEEK